MKKFYQRLAQRLRDEGEASLYTVVESGKPERLGQKLLQAADGTLAPQDESLRGFWEEALPDCGAEPTLARLDGCAVFGQRLARRPRLVLCGGGHIAVPLAAIGAMLDYAVTVIDDRPEFANAQRFPAADQILCAPFGQALGAVDRNPNTDFVIITRGHSADRLCLEQILARPHAYVGMIGSRRKVSVVMDQMKADGFAPERLAAVHAPIGLRIGAQTPAEIAVCIAAELIQKRRNLASAIPVSDEMLSIWEDGSKNFVSATIISKHGSAPREPGACMLVLEDGAICGSVGGGAAEAQICMEAVSVLQNGTPILTPCEMTNEDAQSEGMVCGGSITVFLEKV